MNTIFKTITSQDVPLQLTGDSIRFSSATFWGYSGFSISGIPFNNVSTVYLGLESGRMIVQLTSGSYFNWTTQAKYSADDLSNFWVNGRLNDAVYIVYYP